MQNLLWAAFARVVSRPHVARAIIDRAQRTPYSHIEGPDGSIYMGRWWLFNRYGKDAEGNQTAAALSWPPSVRIHHIKRPDTDRHLHDHPWNARTIVLQGSYCEERPCGDNGQRERFERRTGYTGRLLFGEYHRISAVSDGGVWTMFWTWRKRGTWGFDVDGVKVPWREYFAKAEQGSEGA